MIPNSNPQAEPLSPERLAEIAARAGYLYEYSTSHDSEGDTLAGDDVPALLAEIERLNGELAFFAARVNELESRDCECQPVREHDDYKRPAAYRHAADCPVSDASISRDGGDR